jgi:hypothetical protein
VSAVRNAPALGWRLFLTVWLVYAVFATTNVVRETYLAIAVGEQGSLRVDAYRGLHPDLFEFPGRGWYINSNPGASFVAALPYALLVRPMIALAVRLKPAIAQPKPPASYDDPRPNRTRFMNAARARGLDVTLGLAALGTGITMMAPLGGLAAVLLFGWLRARLGDDRRALAFALLFAFATPLLFRSAFVNQNALVAHLVLVAWILKTGIAPEARGHPPGWRRLAGIGAALGYALVSDYSAIPFLVVFGLWILRDGWRRGGAATALREAAIYSSAASAMIGILLGYQWVAFGHPLWPAQRYMPPTEYSVQGWFGFTAPTPGLLAGNLFDPRYGLFAFSPLLLAALAAPFIRHSGWRPSNDELGWIAACTAGLLLFSSANQFGNLQWNTGVRYMVPAVPLMLVASIPVLQAMPRLGRWLLVGASLAISLAVSMTREDVPLALRMVLAEGPTLPVLLVLRRMASGYDVPVPAGAFWIIAAIVSGVLVLLWRPVFRKSVS